MRRVSDGEADQYDRHQQQVVEDSMGASGADGATQFIDLAVYLLELPGASLLIPTHHRHEMVPYHKNRLH
jgi:hypothetical protein